MFLSELLRPQEKEAEAAPRQLIRPQDGRDHFPLGMGIFSQDGKLKPQGWRDQQA